ncbi:hypothetical protein BC835DRAFT_449694 [Cytidiella melzeri]|nr:hypothetical protein BC835DRAFT_449694 [Cytidiella melzeri]
MTLSNIERSRTLASCLHHLRKVLESPASPCGLYIRSHGVCCIRQPTRSNFLFLRWTSRHRNVQIMWSRRGQLSPAENEHVIAHTLTSFHTYSIHQINRFCMTSQSSCTGALTMAQFQPRRSTNRPLKSAKEISVVVTRGHMTSLWLKSCPLLDLGTTNPHHRPQMHCYIVLWTR